jgi:hypothetical protein
MLTRAVLCLCSATNDLTTTLPIICTMAVLSLNESLCNYLHSTFNKFEGEAEHFHAAVNSTANYDVTWHRDVTLATSESHGRINGLPGPEDGASTALLETIKFYLASVVNPALCVFGMVGNIFNVMVLSRGQIKATLECSMELAAHTGLVALAVSDIMYCACAFMDAVVSRQVSCL